MKINFPLPVWTIVLPILAWLGYFLRSLSSGIFFISLLALILMGAVLAAVHHAEVVAHRVGEPFGTIILALAVTIIEVSLIVSLMLSGGEEAAALARDCVCGYYDHIKWYHRYLYIGGQRKIS